MDKQQYSSNNTHQQPTATTEAAASSAWHDTGTQYTTMENNFTVTKTQVNNSEIKLMHNKQSITYMEPRLVC